MDAILALEDGTWFSGTSFTGPGETGGEVIFNTGMTGYQEILTDPSYTGQMVCMTSPHIGNYGINPEDVESGAIQAEALIVNECCKHPSNWRATQTLPEYLSENDIMGIEGIDTRALTLHLREKGAMRGIISTTELDPEKLAARARELPDMEGCDLASKVSPERPYFWNGTETEDAEIIDGKYTWPGDGPRLVVYDFGSKWNIFRLLAAQGFDLLMVPANTTAEEIKLLAPDAVFLSSGPGDPAAVPGICEAVLELSDSYPIGGICLGHQILGLALGGTTYKLKFGHHGINHPVRDQQNGRVEISSQNHGFAVQLDTLQDCEATHVNLNDQTLEGFRHKTKPIMTLQYHPEAAPGPHDSQGFFARFREMIRKETGK